MTVLIADEISKKMYERMRILDDLTPREKREYFERQGRQAELDSLFWSLSGMIDTSEETGRKLLSGGRRALLDPEERRIYDALSEYIINN